MTQQTATPAVSPGEWEAWRNFMAMRSQLDLVLERQLQRESGISASDYGVLVVLFEADGRRLRSNQLGAMLGWEKSRLSHQVNRMEKRGLVDRTECDTDARGTWIGMTPDGTRAVLGAMRHYATALRTYFFDALSTDELTAIRVGSSKIMDAMTPDVCDVLDS